MVVNSHGGSICCPYGLLFLDVRVTDQMDAIEKKKRADGGGIRLDYTVRKILTAKYRSRFCCELIGYLVGLVITS